MIDAVRARGQHVNGDLYDAQIKALARSAHGEGQLVAADVSATLDNPLCGDRVRIDATLEGTRIVALRHRVRGCLLCQASASMLGLRAPGQEVQQIVQLRDSLAALLRGGRAELESWPELAVFAPVAAYRSRHACVTLAVEAALAALAGAAPPD
ncbi:MAG: iron-sulfur cluster assembly scaffold protein [Burkholderiaceae bacterium]|nr:iron-sulfur cluster assembly scaffold protein [Burkholderiaceae bacterium]